MQSISGSHHHLAPIPPTMPPIRPSKVASTSSSTFLQPPKGTQHKRKAWRPVHDNASESEESKTTKALKTTQKRKCDAAPSADESTDTTKKKKKTKKRKKKPTNTTDDEGDESDDETVPQDEAPEDMDENERALSTSFTSAFSCCFDFSDRKSHGELDITCIHALPLPTLHQN